MTTTETPTSSTVTPNIGAHANVPFLEYAKWNAINWHTLKPFGFSARQGRHEMTLPDDATKDMVFGGAFHTAMLEPKEFSSLYAVMPQFEGHPNSNAHKALKSEWVNANASKIHLTRSEMENLLAMQRAVMEHPTASALLTGKGRNELSIVWRDKPSGELCKGRVDRLTRVRANIIDARATGDAICVVDLKKTSQLHRFDNEVAKYGYHGQSAFYRDGLMELEPVEPIPLIIAIQDEPPYDVVVFNATDAAEDGRKLYRRLMTTLTSCKKNDSWPGLCPFGTLPVILPGYAKEKEGD
jgi:hypothetical protein